jgi:GDP-mannose 6-dehydrogenase
MAVKISVFGLGYVGCVSAACLASDGHTVVGVDINALKVDLVEQGLSPVVEPGLSELVAEGVGEGRLRVARTGADAVHETDVTMITVGTPSNRNSSIHLGHLENTCREIGAALRTKDDYHHVIVRSTVLPGTTRDVVVPLLEETSGKRASRGFGVYMNPEFMREGTAIDDYYRPSFIVFGGEAGGDAGIAERIYDAVEAPLIHTTLETAEMIKYVCNAFHALKVAFGNEIGSLAKAYGVDGQEVMEIFCRDNRLNISPAYLKPGFAFGGSCLPKDLRALVYGAKQNDVDAALLSSVLESNRQHIEKGVQLVEATGRRRVGVLGISFKPGTDDVRESPIVALVETLIGRGYEVSIHDRTVDPEQLVGANKAFLERELPHIAALMRPSVGDVLESSDVVVIANGDSAFRDVARQVSNGQIVIDLVGTARPNREIDGSYEGICW